MSNQRHSRSRRRAAVVLMVLGVGLITLGGVGVLFGWAGVLAFVAVGALLFLLGVALDTQRLLCPKCDNAVWVIGTTSDAKAPKYCSRCATPFFSGVPGENPAG